MRQKVKRTLDNGTLSLWALLAIIIVLHVGSALGINWGLSEKYAFGRLLSHGAIAAIEAALALALIYLHRRKTPGPDYPVVAAAILAIAFAAYHAAVYLIGTEFLLVFGAAQLLRENLRRQPPREVDEIEP